MEQGCGTVDGAGYCARLVEVPKCMDQPWHVQFATAI